jgi:hypothetical protein
LALDFGVPLHVSFQLALPEPNSRLGHPIAHGTVVLMPKASMDENDLP